MIERTLLAHEGTRRTTWDEWERPWHAAGELRTAGDYALDAAGLEIEVRHLGESGAPRRGFQRAYVHPLPARAGARCRPTRSRCGERAHRLHRWVVFDSEARMSRTGGLLARAFVATFASALLLACRPAAPTAETRPCVDLRERSKVRCDEVAHRCTNVARCLRALPDLADPDQHFPSMTKCGHAILARLGQATVNDVPSLLSAIAAQARLKVGSASNARQGSLVSSSSPSPSPSPSPSQFPGPSRPAWPRHGGAASHSTQGDRSDRIENRGPTARARARARAG
jgi:hypothetical protein